MNSTTLNTPIGFIAIEEENGMITGIRYKSCQEESQGEYSLVLMQAEKQLQEYFDGIRKEFSLPLNIKGSPFCVKVLKELLKVPYASTISYSMLAEKCGSPKAARAVGTVMRKNPFVVVIPCHRVITQSGEIGNYSAGGAGNKEWLLTFEKQNSKLSLF